MKKTGFQAGISLKMPTKKHEIWMKNKKLLIFLIILLLNLIPHFYVSFLKPDILLNWFLTDDAFYYFKTAQNVAEGGGITFDGIAPTNGFHPLWMIVCVPVFILARINLFLPLRVLIVIQGLLNAVSGYLLYRIFTDHLSEEVGWVAATFWMFLPAIHGITTKLGLESGINAASLFFLLFNVSHLQENIEPHASHFKENFMISISAILCLLNRLDNIFIILMLGVWLVFRFNKLSRLLILDFCLILSAVIAAYYFRIQTTDNIFNFLPFFYRLIAFSIIIKPICFYLLNLYEVNCFKTIRQVLWRSFIAVTISSLFIGLIFFVIHDLLHSFRGFSRSVLFIDWLFTLCLILPLRAFQFIRCQRYGCDDSDISLKHNWKTWFLTATVYFLPILAVLAGYMSINKIYAGSVMPVSGQIKRWWGTLPNTVYGRPIKNLQGIVAGIFDSGIENGPFWLLTKPVNSAALWLSKTFQLVNGFETKAHPFMLALVWIILLAVLIAQIIGSWQFFSRFARRLALPALAAGCFIHVISYKTTGYLHAKYWYWISEMLFLVILYGLVLGSAHKGSFGGRTAQKISRVFFAIVTIALVINFGFSILRDFPYSGTVIGQYDYLSEKQFIESKTQPGDVIGMTGGGQVAYFVMDRKIVNLDGLINSAEYFEDLKSNKSGAYLRKINLKYIYGDELILLDSDPYRWVFANHLRFIVKGPYFSLYHYCIETCN